MKKINFRFSDYTDLEGPDVQQDWRQYIEDGGTRGLDEYIYDILELNNNEAWTCLSRHMKTLDGIDWDGYNSFEEWNNKQRSLNDFFIQDGTCYGHYGNNMFRTELNFKWKSNGKNLVLKNKDGYIG